MEYKIPKKNQHDVMCSFWTMLKECESNADDTNDTLGKLWVEGWFKQWNTITGYDHVPIWISRKNTSSNFDQFD